KKGDDQPMTNLSMIWPEIAKAAGLVNAHLHDLRHTYASLLASAGVSLPMVGALLGHTVWQTTLRYTHLYEAPLREATERVGAAVAAVSNGNGGTVEPIRKRGRAKP